MEYSKEDRYNISNMLENDGWKLMEAYINQMKDYYMNELATCKLENIIFNRAKLEAYKSIIEQINFILDSED